MMRHAHVCAVPAYKDVCCKPSPQLNLGRTKLAGRSALMFLMLHVTEGVGFANCFGAPILNDALSSLSSFGFRVAPPGNGSSTYSGMPPIKPWMPFFDGFPGRNGAS